MTGNTHTKNTKNGNNTTNVVCLTFPDRLYFSLNT